MDQSRYQSAAFRKLEEVERLLDEDHSNIEQLDEIIKEENDTMANERKKKAYNHKRLEEDIERLAKEKEDVDRLTSLSRDACKLYGDITPGDVTHSDVTLLYENHFKGTHRNMPKKLGKNTSEEKYEVWEKSAEVVQDAFDTNKERLILMMLDKMEKAVIEDHEELDETTYDLHRAFEMFLHTKFTESDKRNIIKEIATKGGTNKESIKEDSSDSHIKESLQEKLKEAELVMDILVSLKPDDYIPFLTKDNLRKRKIKDVKFDQ